MFKFSSDSTNLFGGSVLAAAKGPLSLFSFPFFLDFSPHNYFKIKCIVSGHELKGLMMYFDVGMDDVNFPLMALVDYKVIDIYQEKQTPKK